MLIRLLWTTVKDLLYKSCSCFQLFFAAIFLFPQIDSFPFMGWVWVGGGVLGTLKIYDSKTKGLRPCCNQRNFKNHSNYRQQWWENTLIMNRLIETFLDCPMRWMRMTACSSTAGFHQGSYKRSEQWWENNSITFDNRRTTQDQTVGKKTPLLVSPYIYWCWFVCSEDPKEVPHSAMVPKAVCVNNEKPDCWHKLASKWTCKLDHNILQMGIKMVL